MHLDLVLDSEFISINTFFFFKDFFFFRLDLDSLLTNVSVVTFQVLRSGIYYEYVVAPYKAGARLAYLCRLEAEKGGIISVITKYSDLIAYGFQAVRTTHKFFDIMQMEVYCALPENISEYGVLSNVHRLVRV